MRWRWRAQSCRVGQPSLQLRNPKRRQRLGREETGIGIPIETEIRTVEIGGGIGAATGIGIAKGAEIATAAVTEAGTGGATVSMTKQLVAAGGGAGVGAPTGIENAKEKDIATVSAAVVGRGGTATTTTNQLVAIEDGVGAAAQGAATAGKKGEGATSDLSGHKSLNNNSEVK